jgi:hypothetical protein
MRRRLIAASLMWSSKTSNSGPSATAFRSSVSRSCARNRLASRTPRSRTAPARSRMIPGTGEYSLATSPVYYDDGPGQHAPGEHEQRGPVRRICPSRSTRCSGSCRTAKRFRSWSRGSATTCAAAVAPCVRWSSIAPAMASGCRGRSRAPRAHARRAVPTEDGRPVYGGTPSDQSVMQAIRHLRARAGGDLLSRSS